MITKLTVGNFNACAKSAGDGSYLVIFDFDGDSIHNEEEERRKVKAKAVVPKSDGGLNSSNSTTEDMEIVSTNQAKTPLKKLQKLSMTQALCDKIMQTVLGFSESEYERLVVNPCYGETETLKRG